MKFRPHILKIGVVVAPEHFHAVHANGCPALMVSTLAVTGGKILDMAPERRAQVVILQLVPDSAPSWHSDRLLSAVVGIFDFGKAFSKQNGIRYLINLIANLYT